MKEQALQEIRRRSETATDMKERIRWKVIGMMVETDLSLDHAGEIVDELGDTWCYLFIVHAGLLETGSDGLPLVHIERRRGSGDAFTAFGEAINQSLVLDEEHKKLCLDGIIQAVGVGGRQQLGEQDDVVVVQEKLG